MKLIEIAKEKRRVEEALDGLRMVTGAALYPGVGSKSHRVRTEAIIENHKKAAAPLLALLTDLEDMEFELEGERP